MSDLLVATQAFTANVGGRFVHVRPGDLADASAPVVRGRRNFFKPVEVRHRGRIEEATAEPGRPRRTRLPKQPPAGDKQDAGRSTDYTGWKQADYKAELDRRGIDYPKGVVSNAKLLELLEADDAA